jgi:hypothetical protein
MVVIAEVFRIAELCPGHGQQFGNSSDHVNLLLSLHQAQKIIDGG